MPAIVTDAPLADLARKPGAAASEHELDRHQRNEDAAEAGNTGDTTCRQQNDQPGQQNDRAEPARVEGIDDITQGDFVILDLLIEGLEYVGELEMLGHSSPPCDVLEMIDTGPSFLTARGAHASAKSDR
ncbi:hypothetical protein GCM10009038_30790 [Salinicola rhizosphaerae]|uniref:Uncharacterized protein n=1 Tax=Salinicola rhizosphaerae TaxID=1443141 RepID=A0ABQ3EA42_9GAMM|nr:hypothetical protein GCM10009038_30790 [Salinicola rhizosphaerae]